MNNETYMNPELGVAVTITPTKQGYAVTLIDTDAEEIVEGKLYPYGRHKDAQAYAISLIRNWQ